MTISRETLGAYRPGPGHKEPSPLRPGVVASLVAQERFPVMDEVIEGVGGGKERKKIYCYVPSSDTRPGDTTYLRAGMRWFMSPTGELRGHPEMFVLTPSQARMIEKRIAEILGE